MTDPAEEQTVPTFWGEQAPKTVMPGVHVERIPSPTAARELGEVDLGHGFTPDLFAVHDLRAAESPPASPAPDPAPAAPVAVRCAHCGRDHRLGRSVASAERYVLGAGGISAVQRVDYACSDECAARHVPQPPSPHAPDPQPVDAQFARRYYDLAQRGGSWIDVRFLGRRLLKCPLDLWVLQELISDLRPEVVVETGTWKGGSALWVASIMDLLGGPGRVISVDVDADVTRPAHPRITYLTGSSVDPDVLNIVRGNASGRRILVLLDSDHSKEHVLAELRAYSPMVPVGSYVVVEDVNTPGPGEAVEAFLATDEGFEIDRGCERHVLTFNAWLRRVK